MTWKTAEMGRKRSAARSQLSTLIDVDSVVVLMIVLQRSEALQPQELMIPVVQSKACSPSIARFPLFLVVIVDRGVTGTTVVFRQRQKNRFLGASLAFVAPGDIVGAHLGMSNIITACAKGVHASLSTLRNLSRQTSTQTSVTFFCSPHGF